MTHPQEAEFGRIREWIQTEAAKRSPEEIRDTVARRFEALFEAVAAIPATAIDRVPDGDEWSPLDVLKHASEWNWQVGEDILHVCLMGERPGNPPPTFEKDGDLLISRQRESLESIWAHVSEADPQGFLGITWEHQFFGQLNWREWYFFLGVHAMDHAKQIQAMGEALDA